VQNKKNSPAPKGKRRIVIPFRAVFKWLVRLRRSPRAVAGGFALGVFIAFTPTIGLQIIIVIFLGTLLNLNRPAAILAVWITNVATMVPIYTFNYWLGSLVWEGPPVTEVYKIFAAMGAQVVTLDLWDFWEQFEIMLGLSTSIIIPLLIGSFIVGAVCAGITYLVCMSIIRTVLIKRQKKRVL